MGTSTERPETWEGALVALAARTDDLVVMTAENRAAIRGLPAKLGPRFIDVGICEQTMIGMAAGLALRGRVPVVHALATFLTLRAFEFIRTDVGIPGLPVILVGAVPGLLSEANGPTHQALEDLALMRGIPDMQVVCPADREELLAALPQLVARRGPAYVRYYAGEPALAHGPRWRIGEAEVIAEGRDVTLLTYGFLLGEAVKAQSLLTVRGVSTGLVNLRSLAPLDEGAILQAARRSHTLVVVEDHFATGGLATQVAEVLARHDARGPRLRAIAMEGRWFRPGLLADVMEHEGYTAERIAARVEAWT